MSVGKKFDVGTMAKAAAIILGFSSVTACMYPGMDRTERFGEAADQVAWAQVSDPESAQRRGTTPVTGTDGKRAELILSQHRNSIDQSRNVSKPIVINLGK